LLLLLLLLLPLLQCHCHCCCCTQFLKAGLLCIRTQKATLCFVVLRLRASTAAAFIKISELYHCCCCFQHCHQLLALFAGPAVVSKDAKGHLVFRGAVLEGINGSSLDKRLEEDASFCDIDFIVMMLQQVKFQNKVGFFSNPM
jgi:hypothetical protein